MDAFQKKLRVVALLFTAICVCGCMEVEEQYRISRDGKTDARIVFKIDPQYESLILSDLDRKLRSDLPTGMKVDSTQRINGKAAVIVEGQGMALSTISADDQPMQLVESQAGFLRKRYAFTVNAAKPPDIPIPHRLRVTLPGSIEQTNGRKIDSDTVEFDLSNARRGSRFQVTSTALGFSFGSSGDAVPNSTAGITAGWLLPVSLCAIALGALAIGAGRIVGRRPATASLPSAVPVSDAATPAAQPQGGIAPLRIYCSECGKPQAVTRKFCAACGASLS